MVDAESLAVRQHALSSARQYCVNAANDECAAVPSCEFEWHASLSSHCKRFQERLDGLSECHSICLLDRSMCLKRRASVLAHVTLYFQAM